MCDVPHVNALMSDSQSPTCHSCDFFGACRSRTFSLFSTLSFAGDACLSACFTLLLSLLRCTDLMTEIAALVAISTLSISV